MAERRSFLLRVDPEVLNAMEAWAKDELRSLNGQVEYLLRRALRETGRLKGEAAGPGGGSGRDPRRR